MHVLNVHFHLLQPTHFSHQNLLHSFCTRKIPLRRFWKLRWNAHTFTSRIFTVYIVLAGDRKFIKNTCKKEQITCSSSRACKWRHKNARQLSDYFHTMFSYKKVEYSSPNPNPNRSPDNIGVYNLGVLLWNFLINCCNYFKFFITGWNRGWNITGM